ncbi:hypothetical protein HMPREF9141_0523 [Prevotella multiformis DSM 16608]|uniref:Uncharacterized protein n=1 Tax=Prevotella multiformis DSM 16608 TaxID=888743 RepID=F0F4K7_9BACT|nr:hypothetical protein HMPREF9141_0523 [Prevotella multiformis DSM 16608]
MFVSRFTAYSMVVFYDMRLIECALLLFLMQQKYRMFCRKWGK